MYALDQGTAAVCASELAAIELCFASLPFYQLVAAEGIGGRALLARHCSIGV